MTSEPKVAWPAATLDGVATVRLLAQLVPHGRVVERVIDAPCQRVWEYLADVETSVAAFDQEVVELVITERQGEMVRMRVRSRFMPPLPFSGHVGASHMVMRGPLRTYVVAIGVRPIGADRTLYVQFEGVPRRRWGWLNRRIGRHVERDASAVQRIVEGLE